MFVIMFPVASAGSMILFTNMRAINQSVQNELVTPYSKKQGYSAHIFSRYMAHMQKREGFSLKSLNRIFFQGLCTWRTEEGRKRVGN